MGFDLVPFHRRPFFSLFLSAHSAIAPSPMRHDFAHGMKKTDCLFVLPTYEVFRRTYKWLLPHLM